MAAETAEEAPASTTEVAGTTPMGVEKPAKDTRAPDEEEEAEEVEEEEEEEEEESHEEGAKKKPELEEEKEKDDATAAAMMEQSTASKGEEKEEEEEEERISNSSRKDAEDPPSLEKKALEELKQLVAAAIANHEFTKAPMPEPTREEKEKEKEKEKEEDEGSKDKPPMSVQRKEQEEGDQAKVQAAEQAVAPPAVPRKLKDCLEAEKAVPDEYDDDCDLVGVGDHITKTVSVDEDDDGAKTVEAIEETVVSVATAAASSSSEQPPPLPNTDKDTTPKEEEDEEVPAVEGHLLLLWGMPLVGGGERSDTILAKFLRAREWNVKEALAMIKSTVSWREEFGIEELMEEDLGLQELDKAFFVHGVDREGHPVCYNVFGVFQDKRLYHLAFGDEHKATNFLRWMLQQLERDIRARLDFRPDGVNTMLHVIDLHNSPHLYKKELRHAYKHALHLLQDNYPELVAKQVHINVPWWYLAFNTMMSAFMTQRTRSKFVFAGPTKSAEALFKYISPEQVPVQYGGMGKDEKDPVFCTSDAVTQAIIMPSSKHTVEISLSEACIVVWELRVLGWDVSYGAEFTPDSKGGYTIIVQKMSHFGSGTDEPIVSNSFKVGEPGKLIFIIDNTKKKKKRKTLLYRFKIRNNYDECTT